MQIKEDEPEKRSHYRVDDELEFTYFALPEEPVSHLDVIEQLFDGRGVKHYRLLRALRQLDDQAKEEWDRLVTSNPATASYLKILNRKFELLLNELLLTGQTQKHKVNLSLGGMCFFASERLPLGTIVKLKLVLKPSFDILICEGEVIRVDQYLEQSPMPLNKTSVKFKELSDHDSKILSRHIMYRQTEQLGS